MRLRFVNVRRVLLKTIKQDVFSKVIKELKVKSKFIFGPYERCYPDVPQSTTKGYFQMKIEQRHESKFVFQIESVEGNFRSHSNNLDYYEVFKTEKELWIYVKKFFSKYSNVESLSQAVYRKFRFLRPKEGAMLLTQYNLLKDDLPDGQDFEDFLEELQSFLKN